MLLDFWKQEQGLNNAKNSRPSFEEILSQLKEFFSMQKKMGLDINRVHLHPYGSFFMCYDKSKWQDARDAIVKSSIAVPKYCLNGPTSDDVSIREEDLFLFDTDALPFSFVDPQGKTVNINKETLTYKFDLDQDVECYLQFFIKCKQVYKTAGMGDTISSTGFIYHVPK